MAIDNSKSMEKRIRVRRMRIADYPALVKMQEACFPGMKPWLKEQIESQLRIFPEGQHVLTIDGEVAASASCLMVSHEHYDTWHDWRAMTDSGYIRNHDPQGDTLYGMEIMVSPKFRGLKLSRRLYEARKLLAREKNLRRIMIGGRISGYGKHADKMTAEQYVERVMRKELIDPVLTPQIANEFELKGLIPDYLPSDKDSRGYATFLEWVNPDFKAPSETRSHRTVQVRLCLVQYHMRRINSFEEFGNQCEFFVDLGSEYRSDFVVFPELFTTQLLSLATPQRPGLAARHLATYTNRYLELFRDMAVKYNVNIIGGTQFAAERGRLYNIAYLFRRNGTISSQRKIHVTPNERKWWGVEGGSDVQVFDTDRGKISILICYDIEFPELARIAAARGANILFVPFNTDERYGYLRVRHCAQARAIENQIYVAIAGCAGSLPQVPNADIHYAQCAIFTPSDFPFARDAVASESTPNIETVVVHDVDLELLRRNRVSGTVRPWTDRRKDIYSIRYTGPGVEPLDI